MEPKSPGRGGLRYLGFKGRGDLSGGVQVVTRTWKEPKLPKKRLKSAQLGVHLDGVAPAPCDWCHLNVLQTQ